MILASRRFAALPAGVFLCALVAACATPAPEAPNDTAWGQASVVEELSIGVESGPDEYMLGAVSDVAVDAAGAIFISDRRPVSVRMYDRDGTYVRSLGGQGQGPGEYEYAPMLGVLPDGRLVTRSQNRRIQFFSDQGAYLDSFPVVGYTGLIIDQDSNIYVQQSEGDIELVKYTVDGQELERIVFPPRDVSGGASYVLSWGEGNIYPFPTETQSAWSPLGYLVTGRNDVYDIEVRRPEGAVHLRRDVDAAAVAAEEREEWEVFRRRLVERSATQGRDASYEPTPAVKPFFRQIHAGEDGRIWVFRYVAAAKRDDIEPLPDQPDRPLLTWREPWTYDVFEPDGEFLGSVVVPEQLVPHVFRGDRIWGVLPDADDIEHVVRLRVVPESR